MTLSEDIVGKSVWKQTPENYSEYKYRHNLIKYKDVLGYSVRYRYTLLNNNRVLFYYIYF